MQQKSILITGCSSGIGLESAKLLKERGYRVFACARKKEDVEKLTAKEFESIQLDVNDKASMENAVRTILTRTGGKLSALFNNAGILIPGAVEDLTRELDREQFETNLFGAMALTRLVLPIMRQQGYGRIVQNSSLLGYISVPYCGVYAASKHALEGYSRALRLELRHTAIHVSIINPGPILSALRKNAYQQFGPVLKKQQSGHFASDYETLEKSYFADDAANLKLSQTPKIVVNSLLHALESSRPRVHYYVGWPAKLFAVLNRILPDRTLDWVIAKMR